MGEVLASGRLGRIIHINSWMYNDWIQRPWEVHTLDPKCGGGAVFRQGPHQMDVVRYLAGGMVRSVRGTAGKWQPHYDVEGDYHAFIDFEDGPTAAISFNGYANFDIRELTWGIGEGGRIAPEETILGPKPRATGPIAAEEFYNLPQYSIEALNAGGVRKQDFFGLLVVSCERGDIRQSPDGLYVYTEKGREEVLMTERELRAGEIQALVDAVRESRPSLPRRPLGKGDSRGMHRDDRVGSRTQGNPHEAPGPVPPQACTANNGGRCRMKFSVNGKLAHLARIPGGIERTTQSK